MAHPGYPLRLNVGFLINQPIGSSRDIHFEFSSLDLDQDFHLTDFLGSAKVTRTPQGILVQGDFYANVDQECVRCLVEYQQKIHTTFSELYAFKYKGMTESGLIIPEDGNINLGPLVREYLLLELPIRPLCKEDCQGLCTVCGADLNNETCSHQATIKTN